MLFGTSWYWWLLIGPVGWMLMGTITIGLGVLSFPFIQRHVPTAFSQCSAEEKRKELQFKFWMWFLALPLELGLIAIAFGRWFPVAVADAVGWIVEGPGKIRKWIADQMENGSKPDQIREI